MIGDRQFTKFLVDHELLERGELEEALHLQKRHGGDLYSIVIENNLVDEERTVTAVARQLNIPCVGLKDFKGSADVIDLLSAELAMRYKVIPLGLDADQRSLYLAMANPIDVFAMEEVSNATGCDVMAFLAGPIDIAQTLERCYGRMVFNERSLMGSLFGENGEMLGHTEEASKFALQEGMMEGYIATSHSEHVFQLEEEPAEVAKSDRLDDTLEHLLHQLKGVNPLPLNEDEELLNISDVQEPLEEDLGALVPLLEKDAVEESIVLGRRTTRSEASRQINHIEELLTGSPSVALELDEDISEVELYEHEDNKSSIQIVEDTNFIVFDDNDVVLQEPSSSRGSQKRAPAAKQSTHGERDNRSASSLLFLETVRSMGQQQHDPFRRRDQPFEEFPAELSQAAIRLLSQPEQTPLPPAVEAAPTRDLIQALLRILVDRRLITNAELLAALASIQTEAEC